jgi:MFS family permease
MLINLILMTIFWTVSSFNYYIMTFYLKYIPGSVYTNTSLSCSAEIIAYIASGIIMNAFGVKLAFIISFILAAIGGIFLVIFFSADGYLIAIFVLFAKFGISFAFNVSYLATPQMFPTHLTSTAFGVCNLFARGSTILSPLIAEAPDPVPMSIFSVSCIAAAFLPLFLRPVKKSN